MRVSLSENASGAMSMTVGSAPGGRVKPASGIGTDLGPAHIVGGPPRTVDAGEVVDAVEDLLGVADPAVQPLSRPLQ